MNRELVKVIVPVYKADLDEYESLSLKQCCHILSAYPIVIVKPKSLDISNLCEKYPQLEEVSFEDDFFDSQASYNHLMLSSVFYERFLDSEYILIYQLDAYVFRDELANWCLKSYDYIGAPWFLKNDNNLLAKSLWIFRKKISKLLRISSKSKWPFRREIMNKVGNGGFSLRRVEIFYRISLAETEIIRAYLLPLNDVARFTPEDVFWALEPVRNGYKFTVPSFKEALSFAFDTFPEIAYSKTKKIPFGCHAWSQEEHSHFWKDYIPAERDANS
jgi:hypothetical protein